MPLNLVVQTAFLGDLLLCIPLLKRTKDLWPQHKLGLVCRKGFGDFFRRVGLVDEVFEIQKGQAATYEAVLRSLREFEVDHLISPHESLRTALFVRKIQAKTKIGYKKIWNGFFYDERFFRDLRLPDAMRQLSLLCFEDEKLAEDLNHYVMSESPYLPIRDGRLSPPPPWASMSLRSDVLSETVFADLKSRFQLHEYDKGPVVLIFPGSVWATKRWTETGFIDTGRALREQGCEVLIMGGPGEESLAETVAKMIPGSRSLAGKTSIYESAQLIGRANLVIGNDSASTHLAAVCETPLIAIFGPTILQFGYRPWSTQSYVVQKNLSCRPCGKHGHNQCPIKTHECMKGISASTVVETARAILPRSPSH